MTQRAYKLPLPAPRPCGCGCGRWFQPMRADQRFYDQACRQADSRFRRKRRARYAGHPHQL